MVERSLAERGYFDWELQRHQVTVNRAARRADIDLAWDSGRRYALGQATFSGHGFRPGLLEMAANGGEPDILADRDAQPDPAKIDRLRQRAGGEQPFLVEGAIVRQFVLAADPGDAPAIQQHRDIVELRPFLPDFSTRA